MPFKPLISWGYSLSKRRFSGAKAEFLPAVREFPRGSLLPERPAPLLGARPAPQHLEPQRQRRTEPEGEPGMVGDAVIGERMHQDVQPFAVEHQTKHQGRVLLR